MTAPSVSILITAYHEAQTVGRALQALCSQKLQSESEIIVICPDEETRQAARRVGGIKTIQDPASGKPAALNLGLGEAKGSIIVMTDGDVWVAEDALAHLLKPFADPGVGAVSGRPISISPRSTILGYWSHLLTDAGAHAEREQRDARRQFMVCSGYLYAIRAGLIEKIPEDALAEDAVVSQIIAEKGYRVRYAPEARVHVQYPTTYHDWLIQKVRSTGGYAQPVIARSPLQMRSFQHEATAGLLRVLAYPRSPREFLWTLLLMGARLHLWLLVFWSVRVQHKPLKELWKRAESTKS